MLRALHLKDVGPAERFDLELGERLNVFTGDNGLGKSFVLDVAWWAITGGTWVGRPVQPREGRDDTARLSFEAKFASGSSDRSESSFGRVTQDWEQPFRWNRQRYSMTSQELGFDLPAHLEQQELVVYARADGGVSLWDPARNHRVIRPVMGDGYGFPEPYHFEPEDIWNGLLRDGKPICNGLIADWSRWWLEAAGGKRHPFDLFAKVLGNLSHPGERMTPGEPRRLYLDDVRDYPTILLPYGSVPVVHASAGMRRILALAYLLVWAWTEHEKACQLVGRKPAESIVFLVDEIESHLHPTWQRHIAPSLLHVLEGLGEGLRPQMILTTHSPMVLASLEPHFLPVKDKQFLFELNDGVVSLGELPWVKHGDAVGWLTSDVFRLDQARSIEAERAIKAAYDFMAGRLAELPEGLTTSVEIDRELRRVLPDQDRFWPRWVVWLERKSA